MNGATRKTWLAGLLSASLVSLTGCYGVYNDLVDPCYPERWNCLARESVHSRVAMQAKNGTDLEQTLFNYHFELGSDRITPAGQNLLTRLATRRPQALKDVFVQNSFDALSLSREFDPARAEADAKAVSDLNDKRRAAVLAFLDHRGLKADTGQWRVAVSFPSRIGMYSKEAYIAVDLMHSTPAGDFRPDGSGGASIVYSAQQSGGSGQ